MPIVRAGTHPVRRGGAAGQIGEQMARSSPVARRPHPRDGRRGSRRVFRSAKVCALTALNRTCCVGGEPLSAFSPRQERSGTASTPGRGRARAPREDLLYRAVTTTALCKKSTARKAGGLKAPPAGARPRSVRSMRRPPRLIAIVRLAAGREAVSAARLRRPGADAASDAALPPRPPAQLPDSGCGRRRVDADATRAGLPRVEPVDRWT